jgi:hypothetical protein
MGNSSVNLAGPLSSRARRAASRPMDGAVRLATTRMFDLQANALLPLWIGFVHVPIGLCPSLCLRDDGRYGQQAKHPPPCLTSADKATDQLLAVGPMHAAAVGELQPSGPGSRCPERARCRSLALDNADGCTRSPSGGDAHSASNVAALADAEEAWSARENLRRASGKDPSHPGVYV